MKRENIKNEDDFQLYCNGLLRERGIPFRHRYKSKGRRGQSLNTFTIDGVKMAWPDLIIYLPAGRTVFVELKQKNGIASEEQNNFIEHFTDLGFECWIMDRVEQFEYMLNEWGI